MKPLSLRSVLVVVALGAACSVASANEGLAKAKNCFACHAVDKKLVGPGYKEVAAKYKTDKDAVARLSKKVRDGGVGVWGPVPMPANPQVSADEATTLVKWVLTQ